MTRTANKETKAATQLRFWARVFSVCGSCAGLVLFLLAVLLKVDPAHSLHVSANSHGIRGLVGMCLILVGLMFAIDFVLVISDESRRWRRLEQPSLLNFLYISLLITIVAGLFVFGVFVFLLTPLLWPLALMVTFRRTNASHGPTHQICRL